MITTTDPYVCLCNATGPLLAPLTLVVLLEQSSCIGKITLGEGRNRGMNTAVVSHKAVSCGPCARQARLHHQPATHSSSGQRLQQDHAGSAGRRNAQPSIRDAIYLRGHLSACGRMQAYQERGGGGGGGAASTHLLRMRVYPAESDELLGEHVVEEFRLVRRLHRVRRTLAMRGKGTKQRKQAHCMPVCSSMPSRGRVSVSTTVSQPPWNGFFTCIDTKYACTHMPRGEGYPVSVYNTQPPWNGFLHTYVQKLRVPCHEGYKCVLSTTVSPRGTTSTQIDRADVCRSLTFNMLEKKTQKICSRLRRDKASGTREHVRRATQSCSEEHMHTYFVHIRQERNTFVTNTLSSGKRELDRQTAVGMLIAARDAYLLLYHRRKLRPLFRACPLVAH